MFKPDLFFSLGTAINSHAMVKTITRHSTIVFYASGMCLKSFLYWDSGCNLDLMIDTIRLNIYPTIIFKLGEQLFAKPVIKIGLRKRIDYLRKIISQAVTYFLLAMRTMKI